MTHKYRYAQAVPLMWALGWCPCTGLTRTWSECAVTPPLPDAMAVITSPSTCPPAEDCEQLPILCSSDPSIPTRGPPMTQAGGAGCREGPRMAALLTCGLCFWANPRQPRRLGPRRTAHDQSESLGQRNCKHRQHRGSRSTSGPAVSTGNTELTGQGTSHPGDRKVGAAGTGPAACTGLPAGCCLGPGKGT